MKTNTIQISDFTKHYGKFKAVENMSFMVESGSITGFVGKNGAGKSTTIRSLVDILKPTKGDLSICGLNSQKDAKEIKKIVSYMPSDTFFYEKLRVIDIFEFIGKNKNSNIEKAKELSKYFELDLKKKVGELSLGNRKKVSIIQCLMKNSKVYILDEPTSGLDPLMQEKFFNKIIEMKNKGATVFLSSHNLSEIELYCDRVLIVKNGKIIDDLDLKKAKSNEKLRVTYTIKPTEKIEAFDVAKKNEEKGMLVEEDFEGDVNQLINKLSKLNLETLEIKKTKITDAFRKYYEEEM